MTRKGTRKARAEKYRCSRSLDGTVSFSIVLLNVNEMLEELNLCLY